MTPSLGVCVFCGSSPGNSPAFLAAAQSLGKALGSDTIVYGGGNSGLMGSVATATLTAGGHVLGVIPSAFLAESGTGTTTLIAPLSESHEQIVVSSMHERKMIMATRSRAFIGLPGGYGTLEEVMEMVTWSQLGIHRKPVLLLNVEGFYSSLRTFINGAITSGFISEQNRAFLLFLDPPTDPSALAEFDWGTAALAAIEGWEKAGAGGGTAFGLKWS